MGLILCIESSGPICSVSIADHGQCIAHEFVAEANGHSKHLATLISKVFDQAEIRMSALDAVAISGGPGSYTGLRIGSVMAKGICYAQDIPLISLDTLTLMAHQYLCTNETGDAWLAPSVDARRMEVYAGIFQKNLDPIMPSAPHIVEDQSFESYLDQNEIIFFGSGASKMKDVITHDSAVISDQILEPTSEFMAPLAQQKLEASDFEDMAYYNPNYLKPVYITRPKKSV